MNRLAKLQLIGPAIVFAAVLAAEAAAYALAQNPTSEALWYVNLRLFGLFQQSHYTLDGYAGIPASDLFLVALPMLALGCAGLALRRRLMLALASNLSFVYAAFLLYSWYLTHPRALGPSLQASLATVALPRGPDLYLIAVLIVASLLSASISHIIYMRSVRAGG